MNKWLVLLLLLLLSCNKRRQERTYNIVRDEREESQKAMIIGKQIKTIDTILGDSIDLANKAVLIYNGFDCETCIDNGYRILKKLDSLSGNRMSYVIATSANIGRDQRRNHYYNYVYDDEKDLIRRELKYIYTPVILKLDSLEVIRNAFFPNTNQNTKEELTFIRKTCH